MRTSLRKQGEKIELQKLIENNGVSQLSDLAQKQKGFEVYHCYSTSRSKHTNQWLSKKIQTVSIIAKKTSLTES